MNLDLLGHWKGGAVKDAGDEAIRKHGAKALQNIDIGPLESLYGANKEDVSNYIKSQQQAAINSDPLVQSLAVKAGVPGFESGIADWGATRVGTLTRLNNLVEQKEEKTRQKLRGEKIEDEGRALTQATTLKNMDLQAGRDQFNATLRSQQNQFAFQTKQNQLDRRHERELTDSRNDLTLQMKIMESELADKRMQYDRETARLDRRDRAIAQLMQGLGQLGGAFAL